MLNAYKYYHESRELRDLRINKVPNIKPELVARRSRATNSGKSGLVLYLLACP
jgi:hypothetical protein